MEKRIFDLEDRLIELAIMVSDLIEKFPNTKRANHLGNQGIWSCTAPALLYVDALSGESQTGFIHKKQILLKEFL